MRRPVARPAQRSGAQRGFTLLEIVIVLLLVATLLGVLFNRSRPIGELAEKTAMEQTVATLRQVLAYRSMTLIATGRTDELAALAAANPLRLLERRLENDAGEFYAPEGEEIAAGSWYYDLGRKELVYLVRQAAHFRQPAPGRPAIRFRVQPANGEAAKAGRVSEHSRLLLVEAVPYQWTIHAAE